MSNQKEMYLRVTHARRRSEEPVQVLCSALRNLLQTMDKEDPNVKAITRQVKVAESLLTSSSQQSYRTFSGEGPVATFLAETYAGQIALNGGKITPKIQKLMDALDEYDLNPVAKLTAPSELSDALANFDRLVNGEETRIPIAARIEDMEEIIYMPTGLYLMAGETDMLIFHINEVCESNPNLRFHIEVAPNKTYIPHVYHMLENTIAPISQELWFDCLPEEIIKFGQRFFAEHKLDLVRDFKKEFEELKGRAEFIFENQKFLGLASEYGDNNLITIDTGSYNFVYRRTVLGEKKFVTASIELNVRTGNKFSTSIRPEDIVKDQVELTFNEVFAQMGRLEDTIKYNQKPKAELQ